MLLSKIGLLVIGLAAAAVDALLPLKPSVDSFYQPQPGFERLAPGTILKSRTIAPALLGLAPLPLQGWQLLYCTTALNGTPIATVTTIFKNPLVPVITGRFISVQAPEDSSFVDCAPSYNYQLLAEQNNILIALDALSFQSYLGQGYIVSSPDYESFDAAFGAGRLAGRGILDSMRAVNNFASTLGLQSSNNSIVGIGYSGGAFATSWAASLQTAYAPELKIKGWSSGGIPANLTGTALFLDNATASGFIPAVLTGLAKPNAYGTLLRQFLDRIATPAGRAVLDFTLRNCAPADLLNFYKKSVISKNFQILGDRLYYTPPLSTILTDNILGLEPAEVPTAPVNLYHGVLDEVVPYANVPTLFNNWCRQGGNVRFTSYAQLNHGDTGLNARGMVSQFVEQAFADQVPPGCSSIVVQ